MKIFVTLVALLSLTFPCENFAQQALFIKKDALGGGKQRSVRQTSADQMVQNILQWLQGVYTQNSRKIRQGTLREYLPPSNTQKPRPFQPVTQISFVPDASGNENNFINTGYPPAGSITPQPPFPDYPSPRPEITPPENAPYPYPSTPQPFPTPRPGYPSTISPISTGYPSTGYPESSTTYPGPGYPGPSTGYLGPSTGYPGTNTGYPGGPSTGYPGGPSTGYPGGPSTNYPGPSTGYPSSSTDSGIGSTTTGYQESTTKYPGSSTSYPTPPPTSYPSTAQPATSTSSPTYGPSTEYTSPEGSSSTTYRPSYPSTPSPEENLIPSENPEDNKPTDSESSGSVVTLSPEEEEDLKHPPHIHAIDVQCSKEMMTIEIEFNRQFDGIIYSKGHYNEPECRYVKENSGEKKYKFTVNLNSCGTEFINAFDTQGQSYLENVLVLQNEAGIQEVWDTIRAVRCLWEGNLKKALNVALSVGMLNQEIVTFSGDTAMAKLDIQLGKGPFAPLATGLIKIGELMTLVISVTGDPGFDIQVRDCQAKDSTGENVVKLTDDNGCVLKPKLFGAFQKTRNTGNTGASIIAYAFFSAFKFPDAMDLTLECNVELCKTDCEMCTDPNQKLEPGRRKRRDIYSTGNITHEDSITMAKMLRVILPEDLSNGQAIINLNDSQGICMSTQGFVISSALLVSILTISCLLSAYLWLKNQRINMKH